MCRKKGRTVFPCDGGSAATYDLPINGMMREKIAKVLEGWVYL